MYKRFLLWALVPLVMLGGLLVSCGGDNKTSAKSPADGVKDVQRLLLQSGASDKASGQQLALTRVIVPAGMDLPAHTHPGLQLAAVVEGTLTYSVISGQVLVTHGAGTDKANVETVKSGQSVQIATGDTVMENTGMVHTAKNAGKTPVVIYVSSLFPDGAPASSPAQ